MAFVPGLESLSFGDKHCKGDHEWFRKIKGIYLSTFRISLPFMLGKEYHAIHGEYVFGVIFCYVAFALVVHVPDFWGLKQASHCH